MMRPARLCALAAVLFPSLAQADHLAELRSACDAARDEHEAAVERTVSFEVPAANLKLAADRIAFLFRPQLVLDGGALTLDGGDEPATATITPEQARVLFRAAAAGHLTAKIAFRLGEGALDRPCVAVGGGRFLRVRIAPTWVELSAGSEPPLRLVTPRGALEPAPGAQPVVEISTPTVAGASGRDAYLFAEAALPLKDGALECYRAAPHRVGAIALSIAVASSGAVGEVSALIDSLHDDGVRTCLDRAARALRFPRTHHGGYVTTTVKFELQPKGE
jgi:hypothetical protein